jgi:hypothetical protein
VWANSIPDAIKEEKALPPHNIYVSGKWLDNNIGNENS